MLMGGSQSKFKKYKNDKSRLIQEIDHIAAQYIITQNFKDMEMLTKPDYCENLIVMTSEIIANKMHQRDIEYLLKRITNGVDVKDNTTSISKTIYMRKSDLDDLENSNSTTKKYMCNGIAKFYIKVGHLFSAILTTVNPVHAYMDKTGASKDTLVKRNGVRNIDLKAMPNIPRRNFCNIREDSLINNRDFEVDSNATVKIKPRFCDINKDNKTGNYKTLYENEGMPELEKLYYDIYDFENGAFTAMSEKMKKIYDEDVKTLNNAFTGQTDNNPPIKKFSDIKLKNYSSNGACRGDAIDYEQQGTYKDVLFVKYAEHVNNMMKTTATNQDKLYGILKKLFVRVIKGKTEDIIINPTLTETSLQTLIDDARKIIVALYVKCETDYTKGLEIFEQIVEKQIFTSTREQVIALNREIDNSLLDSPAAAVAPPDAAVAPPDDPGAAAARLAADRLAADRLEEITHLLSETAQSLNSAGFTASVSGTGVKVQKMANALVIMKLTISLTITNDNITVSIVSDPTSSNDPVFAMIELLQNLPSALREDSTKFNIKLGRYELNGSYREVDQTFKIQARGMNGPGGMNDPGGMNRFF